jgi:hypothetical protein
MPVDDSFRKLAKGLPVRSESIVDVGSGQSAGNI